MHPRSLQLVNFALIHCKVSVSSFHRTIEYLKRNLSLPNFVTNFTILSQVVHEKSLTEKKIADIYTNIVTERAKTIYPLYTSHAGGIMMLQLQMLWHLQMSIKL